MKKRILASSMAAVMALSTVSVAAFADDVTATAEDTNVKTKDELSLYVNQMKAKDIKGFGTKSQDKFKAALKYAETVAGDKDATADDYTVAYKMLKATEDALVIRTYDDLTSLVASWKDVAATNILNEEMNDLIYSDSSYSDFTAAYNKATKVKEKDDAKTITDRYEDLDAAAKALSTNDTVTKNEFVSAMKGFETALAKEYQYDAWMRGTVSGTDTSYDGKKYAWGTLWQHINGGYQDVKDQYDDIIEIKTLKVTSDPDVVAAYNAAVTATAVLNGFEVDDLGGRKNDVQNLLNEYHSRLVNLNSAQVTAAIAVATAVATADKGAGGVEVTKFKKEDGTEATYDTSSAPTKLSNSTVTVTVDLYPNGSDKITKTVVSPNVGMWIKPSQNIFIGLDKNGVYVTGSANVSEGAAKITNVEKVVKLKKDVYVDVAKYVALDTPTVVDTACGQNFNDVIDGLDKDYTEINSSYIGKYDDAIDGFGDAYIGKEGAKVRNDSSTVTTTNAGDVVVSKNPSASNVRTSAVDLATAYQAAIDYIANSGSTDAEKGKREDALKTFTGASKNEAKFEASKNASGAEWDKVYTYLYYALQDEFEAETVSYSVSDLQEQVDRAYDLVEKTESALFSERHSIVVAKRKTAIDEITAVKKAGGDTVTTEVYTTLKDANDKLEKEFKGFTYDFGEIYDYIYTVSDKIDNGAISADDTLKAALKAVAYDLTTVEDLKDTEGNEISGNEAFDGGSFKDYNRVYTAEGKTDLLTKDDGVITIDNAKDGPNASHYTLAKDYETLKDLVAKAEEAAKVVKGDLNGDKVVNALDALEILKKVAASETVEASVGDFNADGAVNALDALAILKSVVAQ